MIVGTFQYMAPEQLEGREVDGRADIFAFGAMLYEMLTGTPAFNGKSRASLIAAILTTDPPPLTSMQAMTPLSLERVVKKCLAKDPDERWQSASDLASELRWTMESGSEPAAAAQQQAKWKRATWDLGATSLLVLAIAAAVWSKAAGAHPPSMLFQAALPFAVNEVAVSPEGSSAAVVAYSQSANNYVVWIYRIGGAQPVALEQTDGATYPFWSPDAKDDRLFC